MAISKQDLCGARTAADIERKYNFGKSFSEVMGFAEKAQRSAEEAQAAVDSLNEGLSQEEIFNRLTNNGEAEGIFRGDDGQIYINAEYIVAISKMFAKDIIMTGTFTNTVETYLPPGDEEIELMQNHIFGNVTIPEEAIPLYDFTGVGGVCDGKITPLDCTHARKMQLGLASMADWSGAKKSTVTMTINMANPDKAIHITGTNMWGRKVDSFIGVSLTNIKNAETEERLEVLEKDPVMLANPGYLTMAGNQSVTLNYPISQQKNGIVLVFCRYEYVGAEPYAWQSFFVPKSAVDEWNTSGHTFMLSTGGFSEVGTKYLYINDNAIWGHASNEEAGTSASNIIYNNQLFRLAFVYGV